MGNAGDERDRICRGGNLLFRLLLRNGALRAIHRSAARQERSALKTDAAEGTMSDTTGAPAGAVQDRKAGSTLKMQTTANEVAIEIVAMHEWYGEFHVLRD